MVGRLEIRKVMEMTMGVGGWWKIGDGNGDGNGVEIWGGGDGDGVHGEGWEGKGGDGGWLIYGQLQKEMEMGMGMGMGMGMEMGRAFSTRRNKKRRCGIRKCRDGIAWPLAIQTPVHCRHHVITIAITIAISISRVHLHLLLYLIQQSPSPSLSLSPESISISYCISRVHLHQHLHLQSPSPSPSPSPDSIISISVTISASQRLSKPSRLYCRSLPSSLRPRFPSTMLMQTSSRTVRECQPPFLVT